MPHRSYRSKNLNEFASRIRKLAPAIENLGNEYKKAVANRVHERIVMATPVDTTQALSNWQIATAATGMVHTPIAAYFEGEGGSTMVASVAAVLVAAMEAMKSAQPGYPIVISNVVDYIEELAYYDKSWQATGDWIGRAIDQGIRQGVMEVQQKVVW